MQIGFVRGFGVVTELHPETPSKRIKFSLPSLREEIVVEVQNKRNRALLAPGEKVAIVGTGRGGVVSTLAGFNFSRNLYLEPPLPPLRPDFPCWVMTTLLIASVIVARTDLHDFIIEWFFLYLGILLAGPILVLHLRYYPFMERVDRAQAVLDLMVERISRTIPPPPPQRSLRWFERRDDRNREITRMPGKCLFCDSSDIVDSLKIQKRYGFIRAWMCPNHAYKRGFDIMTIILITFFPLYLGMVGIFTLSYFHFTSEMRSMYQNTFLLVAVSSFGIIMTICLIEYGMRLDEIRKLIHIRGAYE